MTDLTLTRFERCVEILDNENLREFLVSVRNTETDETLTTAAKRLLHQNWPDKYPSPSQIGFKAEINNPENYGTNVISFAKWREYLA